jgi:DNA (cytosine-5)-methyltransferase 1
VVAEELTRGPLRILDLFCGAGGCSMGYARAGFEVVGIDHKPQPNYPFTFIRADALEPPVDPAEFDAVHASPPCQLFSAYQRANKRQKEHLNLIPPTREMLTEWGLPYVIENVMGAPLDNPIKLCGSMFDLDVQRHRIFEANWNLHDHQWPCRHKIWNARFDRGSRDIRPNDRRTVAIGEWRIPLEIQQRAMGIDWMTVPELSQAIPPAYTQFIGEQLIQQVKVAA